MSEHVSAIEAQRLLDAATPGPWVRPSGTSRWFTVPEPVQVDEADWGPEAQERGLFGYQVGTLADERAWRYGDVELMAAAPRLAAEVVRLRRELDARTDQPTAKELLHAVDIQYRAAPPKLPETWTRTEVAHYRHGWLDAMQRVKDSTDTAAAARLLGGGE